MQRYGNILIYHLFLHILTQYFFCVVLYALAYMYIYKVIILHDNIGISPGVCLPGRITIAFGWMPFWVDAVLICFWLQNDYFYPFNIF